VKKIPTDTAISTANEIEQSVVYLVSDRASFVTGAILVVDGGGMAHEPGGRARVQGLQEHDRSVGRAAPDELARGARDRCADPLDRFGDGPAVEHFLPGLTGLLLHHIRRYAPDWGMDFFFGIAGGTLL